MRKEDRPFSGTEIGALIESFRHDLSLVAEEVRGLGEWRGRVEEGLTGIENRLVLVEDAVRVGMPDLYKRISRLETKVGI